MTESIFRQSVELLLSSMYTERGDDGLETKFIFGQHGAPAWAQRVGAHVFFRQRELLRAALFVRENGPAHLRRMSVVDIQNMLRNFVTANYGYLCSEVFFQKFSCSYAERVSNETKVKLAD